MDHMTYSDVLAWHTDNTTNKKVNVSVFPPHNSSMKAVTIFKNQNRLLETACITLEKKKKKLDLLHLASCESKKIVDHWKYKHQTQETSMI